MEQLEFARGEMSGFPQGKGSSSLKGALRRHKYSATPRKCEVNRFAAKVLEILLNLE